MRDEKRGREGGPESRMSPERLGSAKKYVCFACPRRHPDHLFSHHDSRDRKARLVYYQCKKRLARPREASVLCCGDLDQATSYAPEIAPTLHLAWPSLDRSLYRRSSLQSGTLGRWRREGFWPYWLFYLLLPTHRRPVNRIPLEATPSQT